MIPILNQHLKYEKSDTNDIEKDTIFEDDITDDEYDTSSSCETLPLCLKVGIGLLGVGAIGIGICKLLSRNDENIEINEDI